MNYHYKPSSSEFVLLLMTRFFEWQAEGFELVDVAAVYREGRRLVDGLGCANTLVGLCLPKSARLAVLMDV